MARNKGKLKLLQGDQGETLRLFTKAYYDPHEGLQEGMR